MPRPPGFIRPARRFCPWSTLRLVAGVALAAGSAHAQSASSSLSSYRTGYGAGVSGLESPVNLSLISSGSQFTISDGVNQAGAVGSVFASQTSSGQTSSSQSSGGAGQSYSGVGQVAASNQRAATAVVDGVKPTAPAAQDAATASKTLSSPPAASAGAAVAAPTTGNAPGEIVLNGQLNLDGGH